MKQAASRGPGRPPAAKAAHTRKRIIKAAREVFSELGYEAATFQAIAERADLTRPAINHYFPSKRVLFREVVQETTASVIGGGMERARRESTLIGRLAALVTAAVDSDLEDRSASGFLVTAVLDAQRHPELRLIEHESLLHSREFMTWMVTEAIETGEISTDADAASLVQMLIAVLWGVGFYAGFLGTHQEMEALAANLRRLLANELWKVN